MSVWTKICFWNYATTSMLPLTTLFRVVIFRSFFVFCELVYFETQSQITANQISERKCKFFFLWKRETKLSLCSQEYFLRAYRLCNCLSQSPWGAFSPFFVSFIFIYLIHFQRYLFIIILPLVGCYHRAKTCLRHVETIIAQKKVCKM